MICIKNQLNHDFIKLLAHPKILHDRQICYCSRLHDVCTVLARGGWLWVSFLHGLHDRGWLWVTFFARFARSQLAMGFFHFGGFCVCVLGVLVCAFWVFGRTKNEKPPTENKTPKKTLKKILVELNPKVFPTSL